MNFRDTIGHAIEAAATGAVGTATSLVKYVKQLVTGLGDAVTPDTNANTSLHELKHKDASHTFSATTDSNEAIRDQLDTVPASGGAVTWNGTALASIQTEANDALIANNLDHYQLTPVLNPADMTAEVADATVLSEIMTRTGDTSDFVPNTDSLEGLADELAKVPKSDAAVSWNGTALASIEAEAQDAIQGEQLDHILALTDGAGDFPNTAVDGSVISKLISKVSGGDTSSYDETTDSLEAISDKLGTSSDAAGTSSLFALAQKRLTGRTQILEVSVTSAANFGDLTLATVTTQPCLIKSVVVHADTASQTDLTSAAVYGGASKIITFLSTGQAAKANIDAVDEQVSWVGAVRLAAAKTIVMTLAGTGATAVDLTVTIEYKSCVDGGYLA